MSSNSTQNDKEEECSVCLTELSKGGMEIKTACGHKFHLKCLKETASKSPGTPVCPLCRGSIDELVGMLGLQPQPQMQQQQQPIQQIQQMQQMQQPIQQLQMPGAGDPFAVPLVMQQRGGGRYGSVPVPQTAGGYGYGLNARPNRLNLNIPKHFLTSDRVDYSSAKKKEKTEGKAKGEKTEALMALDIKLEKGAVPQDQEGALLSVIEMKAPEKQLADEEEERSAIDIICVVDVSGSMGGKKEKLLKQSVEFLATQLGPTDRMSVVSFESHAVKRCGFKCGNEDGKAILKKVADGLNAGGGTSIGEGLKVAFNALEKREQKAPVTAVLLLTDGQDGSTKSRLKDLKIPEGVSFDSFGLGKDHDGNLLEHISTHYNGSFTYIEDEEMVGYTFATAMGGFKSVVSQQVKLILEIEELGVENGYSIASVKSSYKTSLDGDGDNGKGKTNAKATKVTIEVPDFFAEESKDVLFEFNYGEMTKNMTNAFLRATVVYQDQNGNEQTVVDHGSLSRPARADITAEDEATNVHVDKHRCRILASEAMAGAIALCNAGKYDEATSLVEGALETLQHAVSKDDRLVQVLISDLQESKAKVKSSSTWKANNGAANMWGKVHGHRKQRVMQPSSSAAYGSNAVQVQAQMAYSCVPNAPKKHF